MPWFGPGFGWGRGRGWGWCRWFGFPGRGWRWWMLYSEGIPEVFEKQWLKAEANILKRNLEWIEKRLAQLEAQEDNA